MFEVGSHGTTSGEIHRARDPVCRATLLLAHGAGAPRTHPFITSMADRLAANGLDVITFNFLYAESGRKMPDRMELLEACYRAAVATVRARIAPSLVGVDRLFVGGKSMGGRVAARIASEEAGLLLAGVILLGYPLHPPDRPSVTRDEILRVRLPLLVVQGTRDPFGSASDLARMVGRANVHAVKEGDHSLVVPKRCGAGFQEYVLDGVARRVSAFTSPGGPGSRPS